MAAPGDVARGGLDVRLLAERHAGQRAGGRPGRGLDVAVAGVGMGRADAEGGHRRLGAHGGERGGQLGPERFRVADQVVGRQERHRRARIQAPGQPHAEHGAGRGVPPHRFGDHVGGRQFRQVGADRRRQVAAGHDQHAPGSHQRRHALEGVAQQAGPRGERQQLLGPRRPAERPEARAATAGHDDADPRPRRPGRGGGALRLLAVPGAVSGRRAHRGLPALRT